MPWSNQTGGGGWKGGGNGGPWGQGPRSNGPNPPDLEELLRRSQDKLKRVLPGGGGGGSGMGGFNPVVAVVILVAAIALVGYNFFTFRVDANQVGVVLRFGQFDRQVGPGLSFRLPYPIETVYTPPVTEVRQTTVGSTGGSASRDLPAESLMLTGDENIVDIDFSVQWVVNNARDFLFNVQNVEGTVKATAESAMREVIGRSDIQRVLTEQRLGIQTQVQELMQRKLDQYGAGVQITQVQLLTAGPPAEVIDAFRDVQAAEQDQDRLRNEAQTYANRVVPGARGQASQIIEAANAYRDQNIAIARGQADRFVNVYESYRAAPDVTRQRMYLETMANILGQTDKVVIEGNNNAGVLPYLPLPALSGPRTPATPAPGATQ